MPTNMPTRHTNALPGASRSAPVRYAAIRGIAPRAAEDEIETAVARVVLYAQQLVATGQDARARELVCQLEAELPGPPATGDPVAALVEADAAEDVARDRWRAAPQCPNALRAFRAALARVGLAADRALTHLSRRP